MYRGGYGEAARLEGRRRLQSLTGWGLGINHATAVSSVGACEGAEKGSCEPPPLKNVPSQQVTVGGPSCLELPGDCRGSVATTHQVY